MSKPSYDAGIVEVQVSSRYNSLVDGADIISFSHIFLEPTGIAADAAELLNMRIRKVGIALRWETVVGASL